MKLFLSSTSISETQKDNFLSLVNKPFVEISFALIENAADPYPEESKFFIYETRQNLEKLSMMLEIFDLSLYKHKQEELYEALKGFDVIWVGGGNTYYIRWLMKETGFDGIIRKLLDEGVVYGGGSAGAIVAGETLKYFDLVDDPTLAPEQIYTGLGISKLVLIPHWNTDEFQSRLEQIKDLYSKDDIEVMALEDGQSIIVENDIWRMV